ncbi:hypothetical protein H1C71_001491 [Ictidomys tridecemlineatus]|nr:hypothetical protein H1C71_001491 [Ictidomys tridecemlineatus]
MTPQAQASGFSEVEAELVQGSLIWPWCLSARVSGPDPGSGPGPVFELNAFTYIWLVLRSCFGCLLLTFFFLLFFDQFLLLPRLALNVWAQAIPLPQSPEQLGL